MNLFIGLGVLLLVLIGLRVMKVLSIPTFAILLVVVIGAGFLPSFLGNQEIRISDEMMKKAEKELEVVSMLEDKGYEVVPAESGLHVSDKKKNFYLTVEELNEHWVLGLDVNINNKTNKEATFELMDLFIRNEEAATGLKIMIDDSPIIEAEALFGKVTKTEDGVFKAHLIRFSPEEIEKFSQQQPIQPVEEDTAEEGTKDNEVEKSTEEKEEDKKEESTKSDETTEDKKEQGE